MKTITKGKLNLNRETLVELDPQLLHLARGGVAEGGDGGGGAEPAISVVISNNCNSMLGWNCGRG